MGGWDEVASEGGKATATATGFGVDGFSLHNNGGKEWDVPANEFGTTQEEDVPSYYSTSAEIFCLLH